VVLILDRAPTAALASPRDARTLTKGSALRCERSSRNAKGDAQRQHERRDQQRYALFHRLTSFPFSPKPAHLFELGGSRLRYWLCSSLLSAHLYESELQSLYPGLRLCSLAGSILIVAIAARTPGSIHLWLLERYEHVAMWPISENAPSTHWGE